MDAKLPCDGAPFETIEGDIGTGLLIICDHASNFIPPTYANLGLAETEFERHIAYDIGATNVVRGLARALGAPAVLSRFSRLLIDPNRSMDDPTLIMKLSDGAVIPGNHYVDAAESARRIECFHQPYHQEIKRWIDRALALDIVPAIFSIHSFTSSWKGVPRPWDATILWDQDPRLVKPLLAALHAEPHLVIGENVPYSGELKGDCLYSHGTLRGIAHALIEIRQSEVGCQSDVDIWINRLARIMPDVLQQDGIHEIRQFGSKSDREPAVL